MKNKNIIFLSSSILKILLLFNIIYTSLYRINNLQASENLQNQPTADYLKALPNEGFYILGIGDKLKVKISEESKELDQIIQIDGQGTAFLKRLKRVYIEGLTIKELTNILNKEYKKYIFEPDVELSILSYRPVKVYVEGEVENPGLHVIPGSSSPLNSIENINKNNSLNKLNLTGEERSLNNNVFFPSIIDALRASGGITVNAALDDITIRRINNISSGGGKIQTNINLLKAIDLQDLSQNIRILDGDAITVGKNINPVTLQISKAIKTNINPKFINIVVAGRVQEPGNIKINKTSVLTEAIELAGGTKFIKGNIRFLRYNNDGSIDRRIFRLSNQAKRGSYKNPFLRNGDIILVGKSYLNIANEVIGEFTSPLQGIVQSYGFYKILSE